MTDDLWAGAAVVGMVAVSIAFGVFMVAPSAEEIAERDAQNEAFNPRMIAKREREERLFAECMTDMPEYQCEALLRR